MILRYDLLVGSSMLGLFIAGFDALEIDTHPLLQCIGATTLDEYRKHIEKDPALERRFQPVLVPEPTVDETIQILKGLRERYEIHHKLRYTDEALVAAAQLSYQYIRSDLAFQSNKQATVLVKC
jgi:hypothetical protein